MRCAVLFLTISALAITQTWGKDDAVITQEGVGTASTIPDKAIVFAGVTVFSKNADQASRTTATLINKVYKKLGEQDWLERKDITTASYSITDHYKRVQTKENGTETIKDGYVVEHMLRIEVNKRELVGRIIDASTAAGVNTVQGVTWESSNADNYFDEARIKATIKAKHDAEITAKALGYQLSEVVEVYEVNFRRSQLFSAKERLEQPTTDMGSGQLNFKVTVRAKWRMTPLQEK